MASESNLPVRFKNMLQYIVWNFNCIYFDINRDCSDIKHSDEYDVTLLVAHEPVPEDTFTLFLKYYVILSSKREFYPRLVVEKKPGKFRTVSSVAPVILHSLGMIELLFILLFFIVDRLL